MAANRAVRTKHAKAMAAVETRRGLLHAMGSGCESSLSPVTLVRFGPISSGVGSAVTDSSLVMTVPPA